MKFADFAVYENLITEWLPKPSKTNIFVLGPGVEIFGKQQFWWILGAFQAKIDRFT